MKLNRKALRNLILKQINEMYDPISNPRNRPAGSYVHSRKDQRIDMPDGSYISVGAKRKENPDEIEIVMSHNTQQYHTPPNIVVYEIYGSDKVMQYLPVFTDLIRKDVDAGASAASIMRNASFSAAQAHKIVYGY